MLVIGQTFIQHWRRMESKYTHTLRHVNLDQRTRKTWIPSNQVRIGTFSPRSRAYALTTVKIERGVTLDLYITSNPTRPPCSGSGVHPPFYLIIKLTPSAVSSTITHLSDAWDLI